MREATKRHDPDSEKWVTSNVKPGWLGWGVPGNGGKRTARSALHGQVGRGRRVDRVGRSPRFLAGSRVARPAASLRVRNLREGLHIRHAAPIPVALTGLQSDSDQPTGA